MNVQERRNRFNNTAPEYVSDLIRFNLKGTTIRTRVSFDPYLLGVPPISKIEPERTEVSSLWTTLNTAGSLIIPACNRTYCDLTVRE